MNFHHIFLLAQKISLVTSVTLIGLITPGAGSRPASAAPPLSPAAPTPAATVPPATTAAQQEFDQIRSKWFTKTHRANTTNYVDGAAEMQQLYALTQGPLKNDVVRRFFTLQGMSLLSFARSDTDKAIECLEECLKIAERQPPVASPRGMAWASWNIAREESLIALIGAHQTRGMSLIFSNVRGARSEFETVVALSRNVKYATVDYVAKLAEARAETQMLIANTYQIQQRFREAQTYQKQAWDEYRFLDAETRCRYHAGMAACYMGLGLDKTDAPSGAESKGKPSRTNRELALEELTKALEVVSATKVAGPILSVISATLAQLSSPGTPDASIMGDDSDSLGPEYSDALALTRGLLLFVSGKDTEAESVFIRGLKRARTNQWNNMITACEASLGDISLRRGDLTAAGEHYRLANEAFERQAFELGDPTVIGSVQQSGANFATRYAEVLIRQKKLMEALAVVDGSRGTGLMRQASSQDDVYAGRVSPDAIAEVRRLRKQYVAAQTEYQNNKDADTFARRVSAKAAWEKYAGELPARFPEYGSWLEAQRTTPQSLTRLADANPDTLFIHINTTDTGRTLIFTLSRSKGVEKFILDLGARQWETLVKSWNESIQAAGSKDKRLSAFMEAQARAKKEPERALALYKALFGPLEKGGALTGFRRIVLVPDGPLWDAPFAALMTDKTGKRLIDRFPISVAVSLRQALSSPESKSADNRTAPSLPLFYVADPPIPPGKEYSGLVPLRVAADAAINIASKVPGADGLKGQKATKKDIVNRLAAADVLFFATHGFLIQPGADATGLSEESYNGLDSYLLVAPETPGDTKAAGDRRLNGRDLLSFPRPLSARMAVLMACSSGEGVPAGGEGLMGLVWSFWGAGCPSVIASGWDIDQEASSRLMTDFWTSLQTKKLPKDEALRIAINKMRQQDKRYGSPYFWASFQVYGSTKRL